MYVKMYICIKICENASEFIPKFIILQRSLEIIIIIC